MELSGNWLSGAAPGMGGGDYTKGWIPLANHTQWVPPFRHPDAEDVVANDADWPSVHWPHYEVPCGICVMWMGVCTVC